MMNDMNTEGEGPSLEEAYHSVIELMVGVISAVPIAMTFCLSLIEQTADLEWVSVYSIALLSSFSQSLGYLNSLYKRDAMPKWLTGKLSRYFYLRSLGACIASATLSFVGALAMLYLIKNNVFFEQLKWLLPYYLLPIIWCSLVNLTRMVISAALSTKYAVTGELKIVGYVDYISEALNKLK